MNPSRFLKSPRAISLGGLLLGSASLTAVAGAEILDDWLWQQAPAYHAWDIGGQLRLRYEAKDNAGSFPNRDFIADGQHNSNDFFTERLRLHAGYTPTPWFTAYVEVRSNLEKWDERQPSPDLDSFNLGQAYLVIGDPQQFPLLAKIGRQELSYGEQRFVGVGDWSNTGRTFDAAKLRYESGDFWLDAFAGRVVVPYNGQFDVDNDYDWLWGLYGSTKTLIPWQETQFYFLARNVGPGAPNAIVPGVPGTPSTARNLYTVGTRWASTPGKLDGWDYSLEAAGQFGSIVQANVWRKLESCALFASGGYTWKQAWGTPRLGLGYEFGSGDSNPNDGKVTTFENLFGTIHRYYGTMDLFCQRNMRIPRLSTSLEPVKNLTLTADYLFFWLADTQDYLYPESGSGRNANGFGRHPTFDPYVGSELDIVAKYTFPALAELQLGYGHFFAGEYIKQSVASVPSNGGTVDANWAFFQVLFTF